MEVKQLFDILRKEAECSFCIHPFNKPKTLPCLHSFCLDCLNKYAATRRKQGHTTFDCPECLATFQLPDNDKFDAFQTAFHKNRLFDILALEKSCTDKQKNCDNCDRNVAPDSYCFECQTFLCLACLDAHDRLKVTQGHRKASLQNLQTADVEALIQRPVLCDKQSHEREPLEYYCEDCRVCICHKCALVGHNKHSLLDISGVAEKHKERIIKYMEQMKSRVSEYKQEVEKSKKHFGAVEQQIEEAKHKTQATVEELIRDLKKHEAIIMRELDKVHQTQQQTHLAKLKNFELSLAQLDSAIEYAEAIITRNMGPEVLQTQEAITYRCDELLSGQKFISENVRVSLVTNDELCRTVHQSALGRVVVSSTDPSYSLAEGKGLQEAECGERAEFTVITKDAEGQQCYYKRDQVTVHIQTAAQEEAEVKIEDKKDGTYHVTYVPQRHGQHHVLINVNEQPLTSSPWNVNVTPHQYQAIWSFGSVGTEKGQFDSPCGISVSSTGNIAVADYHNKRVQVFTLDGEFLRKFGQERLKRPYSVVYISPDHIIVIDSNSNDFPNSEAKKFTDSGMFLKQVGVHSKFTWSVSSDGRFLEFNREDESVKVLSADEDLPQSVSAPNYIVYPLKAVCHKEKLFLSRPIKNCIEVFDMTGKYLHDIGAQGSGDGQLQRPRGVAVDKFGNLLVVDANNHRLQVFTTEGEFVSKTGGQGTGLGQFKEPRDVAVSKDGHVYVTDTNNNRVQILI